MRQVESLTARLAAGRVVFLAAEGVRIMGILLQPFLPGKAAQLLDRLGVADDRRTFAHTALRCDPTYGTPREDLGSGRATALFPPLVGEVDTRRTDSSSRRKSKERFRHPIMVSET